jgi:polyphosphate kinase 2 (PPK2 family)
MGRLPRGGGDMVDRTSTEIALTLVEANDKRWARVKVLRTINRALEEAFEKSDRHEDKKRKDKD